MQAGEALQRVLLTATVEGLAVSLLSQLVEVAEVRNTVQPTARHSASTAGRAAYRPRLADAATPRRDVADLLVDPETSTRP